MHQKKLHFASSSEKAPNFEVQKTKTWANNTP